MKNEARVQLDLNNPVFLERLLTMEKPDRHSALETLNKLRQMTWNQVYRDGGLKWRRSSPQAARGSSCDLLAAHHAVETSDCVPGWEFMRFLTVAPDHDATYGKK